MLEIEQPIPAGELQKLAPKATIGEICHTVWDLIEANEIEVLDESHIIISKGRFTDFRDTTEIDALIAETDKEILEKLWEAFQETPFTIFTLEKKINLTKSEYRDTLNLLGDIAVC